MPHHSTALRQRGRRPMLNLVVVALLTMALLAAALPGDTAAAAPPGYTFTHVATLGVTPAPGGGFHTDVFEPYALNARGDFAFVSNVSTGGQGVFAGQPGQYREIFRAGQAAPGGGTFGGFGSFGQSALNDAGDVAVGFGLDPYTEPLGLNAGVYRHTRAINALSAVIVPGVTPAPEGGVFAGAFFHANINNRGDIVTPGIFPTQMGIRLSGQPYSGLGTGLFRADKKGKIASIVSPGDVAPGGGRFDFVTNPWINDCGDVAFGAHVAGEECIDFGTPQSVAIFCAESVYLLLQHPTRIISIAHQGQPAPGGGVYRLAFGTRLNNRGEVAFVGDLTPAPGALQHSGIFLYARGTTRAIARPGDAMPGGGVMVTTTQGPPAYSLNNRGDVTVGASLDTNGDDTADAAGMYVTSQSGLRLVARTGTVIPGLGTIAYLSNPGDPSLINLAGGILNDSGQILLQATLTDGRGVLLIASPHR
ncbi:MAG: hypothetical protein IT340_14965 [Chloroflexi bacterium]|nr:hypothetical protein [Chloroflexota bacterium]